jgi:hypothetical protein
MVMNRIPLKALGLIAFCSLLAMSCEKKPKTTTPAPTPAEKREVHINFVNFAGNDSLKLGTQYTNASNEAFTLSMFNYYISNVKLQGTNGTPDYVETESYHLVKQDKPGSGHFHLEEVPIGDYKSISFIVGVDSTRNVSGAQTGALAQDNGMFWTWSTGYIMAKMEGNSTASTQTNGVFKIHTGGFSGANNVLRTVILSIPSTLPIKSKMDGDIVIEADALKWFGPDIVKIADANNIMMPGPQAVKIADNYSKMFSIISTSVIAAE